MNNIRHAVISLADVFASVPYIYDRLTKNLLYLSFSDREILATKDNGTYL
jgi:hypothetical protein